MRPYVVRQGDYLTKLAFVHGFDVDEVWGDPKNDEIRGLRKDHHILAPGDVVYLPVKEKEGLPIQKGVVNRYVAKVPRVDISLVFKDDDGKLIAGEDFEILGSAARDGRRSTEQTKDDGSVCISVPVTTREVSVLFPRRGITYVVRVGDMDPHEEMTGVMRRLENLGFYRLDPELGIDHGTALRAAIRAFQRSKGLEPTGELDDTLKKAIADDHAL